MDHKTMLIKECFPERVSVEFKRKDRQELASRSSREIAEVESFILHADDGCTSAVDRDFGKNQWK
jgi:hypothetical protein